MQNLIIDENIAFPDKKECGVIISRPLKIARAGIEYETLRLRTEKHHKNPKVFMLTIGNLTMRKARASFASNFF